ISTRPATRGRIPGGRDSSMQTGDAEVCNHDVYSCTMAVTTAPTATATVGVAGSPGYAGRELLRLLAGHPRLCAVTCTADTRALAECDLAMLALPHGATSGLGRELAGACVPVVDLAHDTRREWTHALR